LSKSNAKLGHGARFLRFIKRESRLLGRDSVARNNTCDMLEEARLCDTVARLSSSATSQFRGGLQPTADSITAEQAALQRQRAAARAPLN